MSLSASAPNLRSLAVGKSAGPHPTPAARLGLTKDEVPAGWTVPRHAPHMADYIYDSKTAFLRKPAALPKVGEPVAPPKPKYSREGIVEADAAKKPYGWDVPHYDMVAANRAMHRKFPRGKYLPTKELVKRRDVEARPGGLATGKEEECDVPYGWGVKRYAPHMAHFHTDSAMGWTHLRSTRAPQHDSSAPPGDGRLYMNTSNILVRDGQGRAALDKRTAEEHANDVPYGWGVTRYAPNAIPRVDRTVQDPAVRYYAGATPSLKHSQSEFRA